MRVRRRRARRLLETIALAAGLVACASLPPPLGPAGGGERAAEAWRRAEGERAQRLEEEVRRLRADLARAEEAVVAAESGLRSDHSRADAVSSLAEARIQVERAARAAPWRSDAIAEARVKLEEADAQVKSGHLGSAMFFVYRAERIASDLQLEAEQVARAPNARFVRAGRANLRSDPHTESEVVLVLTRGTPVFPETEHDGWLLVRTPAGPAGWIYTDLVSEPATTTQSLPASLAR